MAQFLVVVTLVGIYNQFRPQAAAASSLRGTRVRVTASAAGATGGHCANCDSERPASLARRYPHVVEARNRPESVQDRRQRLRERLRAEFIAGAEEDSRRWLGRGLTAEELERVLRRYPGNI